MGCGISTKTLIQDRMGEFQLRNPSKEIQINFKTQILNQPHFKIGEYFTVDIQNQKFKYFESRFTTLIQKEIESQNVKINWASPESFIISLLQNKSVRKDIIGIITRKGFEHSYRWLCWRLFAQMEDSSLFINKDLEKQRKELYQKLIKSKNAEVEDIVNKDVLRTARHKELFSNFDAIGSQLLYDNCKAVGCFFPKTGYVQGMNFIMAFLLEISGMEEFETFNFVVNFWKKRRNLYFGLFEAGLPLVQFLKFSFHKLLQKKHASIAASIKAMHLPDELWITKWFLSFYSFSVTKEFLIRIYDFLMVVDLFGMVYVALIIVKQLKKVFSVKDIGEFAIIMGNAETLCSKLNYHDFVKSLKKIEVSKEVRLNMLEEYYKSCDPQSRQQFEFYYKVTKQRLTTGFKENYDEWEPVKGYNDMDDPEILKTLLMKESETA